MQLSSFYHIFLYVIMLAMAFMVDYNYRHGGQVITVGDNKEKRKFSGIVWFFIIGMSLIYVFTEGLRYGRGVDQLGNYGPYYIMANSSPYLFDFEPLFTWLNKTLNSIDPLLYVLPFGSIFFVYAIFFIISLVCLYSIFKDCSKYFLVFAILATLSFQEGFIRQALSASLIFIAIYFYEKSKWKVAIVFLIASLLIHKGNILFIGILVLCKFLLKNKCINWKLSIPIFLLFEFIVQLDTVFNFIQDIAPYLNLSDDDSMTHYITDTDYIEHEMEAASEWKRGTFTQLITVSFYMSSYYVCSYIDKRYKKYNYLFNTFIICSLIFEPFRLYGTLSRAFYAGALLWFIPLSISFYEWKRSNSYIFKLSVIIMLLYVITYWGRFIFLNPDAKYVWDLI